MAQAKTLTPAEIEQLLSHINTRKYAVRNRSMMLLTHWAGLRIGEVAGLRWSDVIPQTTPNTKVFRVAVQRDGVGAVGLHLDGIGTSLFGCLNDFECGFNVAVVVGRHFGYDVGGHFCANCAAVNGDDLRH